MAIREHADPTIGNRQEKDSVMNLLRRHRLASLGATIFIGLSLSVAGERLPLSQSPSAAALHREAIVVDGHVHITTRVFWEGIDPWKAHTTGLWDYARAKQGGLDLVIEHVLIQDEFNDYNVAVKHACRLIETFYRVLEANGDKMELALTSADVRRIAAAGKMAVILALEGGFDMEGDLDVLRLFHRLGVRMVQFVNHQTTNAYADAGLGEQKWNGITDHGRAVIREMNRLGIVIDISHASDAAQLQIIEASQAPVTSSHSGLRHFVNLPRNLSDEVLKALAARGGLMGMASAAFFLSQEYNDQYGGRVAADLIASGAPPIPMERNRPRVDLGMLPGRLRSPDQDYGKYLAGLDADVRTRYVRDYLKPWKDKMPAAVAFPTAGDWADQVDYVVKLAGADHVGIGLDMTDGGKNLRDFDATSYPRLTEALAAKNYTPTVIRKIVGENWLRLLDAAKVPVTTRPVVR